MTPLPPGFRTVPLAHRGLHDRAAQRPENSIAAFRAAIAAGYGIELDVQPARDGEPMVFHDDRLARMTGAAGTPRDRDAADLIRLPLHGTAETIPTMSQVLDLVDGRVPLLVEIKDQPGDPRHATNPLTRSVAARLAAYRGPVAIMSFNPFAIAHGAATAPGLAWGLTTGHPGPLWPTHPALEADTLGGALDPRDWGGGFISHGQHAADAAWLSDLQRAGIPVLAWTIRSPQEEARARHFACNITFEGYRPAVPQRGA